MQALEEGREEHADGWGGEEERSRVDEVVESRDLNLVVVDFKAWLQHPRRQDRASHNTSAGR
eukprot:2728276-Rhodomonas_salina.1